MNIEQHTQAPKNPNAGQNVLCGGGWSLKTADERCVREHNHDRLIDW